MISSNALQPLKLIYKHNIVTKSVARIFVNTFTGGLDDSTVIGQLSWSEIKIKKREKALKLQEFWEKMTNIEKQKFMALNKA